MMNMIADRISVDGTDYQRAGIVVNGVVYLQADYGSVDLQAVGQRVAETIRKRSGGIRRVGSTGPELVNLAAPSGDSANPPKLFPSWCFINCPDVSNARLAGLVSEANIGGVGYLRVEFPATAAMPAGTFYFAPGRLTCIEPCTEERARTWLDNFWGKASGE